MMRSRAMRKPCLWFHQSLQSPPYFANKLCLHSFSNFENMSAKEKAEEIFWLKAQMDDIFCDICRLADACEVDNVIVICEVALCETFYNILMSLRQKCDVAVHQACYGIETVPDGIWVCQPCAKKQPDATCSICPVTL